MSASIVWEPRPNGQGWGAEGDGWEAAMNGRDDFWRCTIWFDPARDGVVSVTGHFASTRSAKAWARREVAG